MVASEVSSKHDLSRVLGANSVVSEGWVGFMTEISLDLD
jgi:hypothetical protein